MPSLTKSEIRNQVWERLCQKQLARFPFPTKGRIPNFKGAEAAADRLVHHPVFENVQTLKCNPDAPQLPVRLLALKAGRTVYMAVPRLRKKECFLKLDPARIDPSNFRTAVSIKGAERFGLPVEPGEMAEIDLIVAGSVAVRTNGARVGKGGGYSDLEFGIATQLGIVGPDTVIATTVHEEQLVEDKWAIEPWDIPLDWIFTPERSLKCRRPHVRPAGVLWEKLDPDMRRDIPILDSLA